LGDRRPLVPVLVGPTASGKTAVAVALSEFLPITVISADSRQVYKKLDIGTAKPTREERERVPHLGIDVVAPGERYSAGRYARDAVRWMGEVGADRQPLVVGGTGFYVRALADGLFREPPIPRDRRDSLREWMRDKEGMGRWAARLDPGYSGGGHQRASRAVEVALLTGRSLSWWQKTAETEGIMRPWFIRLTLPRATLHTRIVDRTRAMIGMGLVDEVRGLLDSGVPGDAPGLDAVGYREVVRMLDGRMSAHDLEEAIATATRQYAKRQKTWFRHQLIGHPVVPLDATDTPSTLARRIAELWNQRGL
jgi:tRNA dimethylallyltransferase